MQVKQIVYIPVRGTGSEKGDNVIITMVVMQVVMSLTSFLRPLFPHLYNGIIIVPNSLMCEE